MIAADHDQPAAEILHIRPRNFHLSLRQIGGRHIRDNQEFIVLQVGERIGHPLRGTDIDLDPFLFERPTQIAREFHIVLNHQDPRLAGGENKT